MNRHRVRQISLFSCFVASSVLISTVAVLRFGSLASGVAYLRGQRIVVDGAIRNLGDVQAGDERIISFSLANVTGRSIRVLGSRLTCGCTESRGLPQRLSRTALETVELVFHPWEDQAGTNVEGRITLFLDDPLLNQLELSFNAFVTSGRSEQEPADALPTRPPSS